MREDERDTLRQDLLGRREELTERLERINANVRRPLEADSAERAKQLEDSEVVDALGNDARDELAMISGTLARMDAGTFGICVSCGETIEDGRLAAYPYATRCITCARGDEAR